MRIVACSIGGLPSLGIRVGEELIDLTEAGLPSCLKNFLGAGQPALEAADKIRRHSRKRHSLSGIVFKPPLASPDKALAVGLNYRDHASESHFEAPEYPVLFHRFPSSWVAHGESLVRPAISTQFDYEGELVVVIGRPGHRICRHRALEHVAGYSIFNDGSVRDFQFKSAQWMMGKNFDCSGGFGPEFVTADELPPGAAGLRLTTRLNGQVVQEANTTDMIFDVATLVSVCSDAMALKTGDLIISGTPAGVGIARKPPLFMKAGDRCDVEVEGIGVLSNPVVDEYEANDKRGVKSNGN